MSVESVESVETCVVQFFGSVHHWRVKKEKEEKEGKRGQPDLQDKSPLFIPLAETRHVTCYCVSRDGPDCRDSGARSVGRSTERESGPMRERAGAGPTGNRTDGRVNSRPGERPGKGRGGQPAKRRSGSRTEERPGERTDRRPGGRVAGQQISDGRPGGRAAGQQRRTGSRMEERIGEEGRTDGRAGEQPGEQPGNREWRRGRAGKWTHTARVRERGEESILAGR